jgi:acyl carrier protein
MSPCGSATTIRWRGVIDSLDVMALVGFVEETWDLKVGPADITEANLRLARGNRALRHARRGD